MFVSKIILFMLSVAPLQCRLPDIVYCANEECSEPISNAKSLLKYSSPDEDLMSYPANADAIVYMKSAGTQPDVWYVTINGKSGFVTNKFLRETKIFVKDPPVKTSIEVRKKVSQNPDVQPDKVQQAHEVIDGTTIYPTEASSEQDATTESPTSDPVDKITPIIEKNQEAPKSGQGIEADTTTISSSVTGQTIDRIEDSGSADKNADMPSDKYVGDQNQNTNVPVNTAPPGTIDSKVENDKSKQINQALPSSILAEALSPTPEHGASSNEQFEVPDLTYVQTSLNEPENVDSNESNTSLPHNLNDAKQNALTDSSSETPNIIENNDNHVETNKADNKLNSNDNLPKHDIEIAENANGMYSDGNVISDVISAMFNENILLNENKNEHINQNPTENDQINENSKGVSTGNDQINENAKGTTTFSTESDEINVKAKGTTTFSTESDEINVKAKGTTTFSTESDEINVKAKGDTKFSTENDEISVKAKENTKYSTENNEINDPAIGDTTENHINENVRADTEFPTKNENRNEQVNAITSSENNELNKNDIESDPISKNSKEDTISYTQNDISITEAAGPTIPDPVVAPMVSENVKADTEFPSKNENRNEQVNAITSRENNEFNKNAKDIESDQISKNSKEDTISYTQNDISITEPAGPTIPEPVVAPLVSEKIPTDTIPAVVPEVKIYTPSDNPKLEIPITTDTLPPVFTSEAFTDSSEAVTPDPYTYYKSSESNEQTTETYTETSPSDMLNDVQPTEETYTSTEAPSSNENTEGFLSSMYSMIADIWPQSTEQPPPLFNTDEYPTYEEVKAENDKGFSIMSYLMTTYYSVMGANDDIKALFPSHGETCFSNEYCDGKSNGKGNRLLTFLVTTASSVLLFTLGYYYIDSKRQDSRLIGSINSLQRDLMFSTKECEILKEELSTTKTKLAGIEDSSFGMDDMVLSLKEEINELKAQNERLRNSLDDNEKLLRVSENTAGELQNTLSEVENTLGELWGERAGFEDQIAELNGKIQAFEEELIAVSRDRDSYQLKYASAEAALEESNKYKKQLADLNQQLADAKNTIELQKHEIVALKDAMKEMKVSGGSNVDVSSLIDHTEIKAKLSKALEERDLLSSKYEMELTERKRLSEELHTTQESFRTTSQQATEAMTRLEVLGKYFQERESELMKELSAKESLWLSKQGESASTVEKIELLQQELTRFKEKCDALTRELAEQESNKRSAISEVEARAHSAWLEARAARREADLARDEAATLRRKLASMSAADGCVSPHHKVTSPLDVPEGVIPPPLPPLAFLPPLLPPLPRPPPLGRLPSPHPPRYGERRYSPDSRYSPENRYSPESRYSPETVRYSPDSRYSPRSRRSPYSPRVRRRSRDRYEAGRSSRSRNGPPAPVPDTETEYNSDSPTRSPRRRYSRHSGPSSGSGCSSDSEK